MEFSPAEAHQGRRTRWRAGNPSSQNTFLRVVIKGPGPLLLSVSRFRPRMSSKSYQDSQAGPTAPAQLRYWQSRKLLRGQRRPQLPSHAVAKAVAPQPWQLSGVEYLGPASFKHGPDLPSELHLVAGFPHDSVAGTPGCTRNARG